MSQRRNPSPIITLKDYNDDIRAIAQFQILMKYLKSPKQERYGVKPYIEQITGILIKWVVEHEKLPHIALLDLTQKENKILTSISKDKGFSDVGEYLQHLIRKQLVNG